MDRERRKKKERNLSFPLRIIIDPQRVQRTRLELNSNRFSVDDHKKCRAVESIYRPLNLISRLSRKFNWFQSSITDELRYARGKGGRLVSKLVARSLTKKLMFRTGRGRGRGCNADGTRQCKRSLPLVVEHRSMRFTRFYLLTVYLLAILLPLLLNN